MSKEFYSVKMSPFDLRLFDLCVFLFTWQNFVSCYISNKKTGFDYCSGFL